MAQVSPESTQDALIQSKVMEIVDRLHLVSTQEPTYEELPDEIARALTMYASGLVANSGGDIQSVARALYGALVIIWREGVDFGRFLGSAS